MQLSHFIRQKPYEHIEHLLRRHPFTFLPKIGFFLLLTTLPIILIFMLKAIFPTLFTHEIYFPILILVGSTYFLFITLFFYTEFTDYYLDLWIITNDRIIDVEQLGLFKIALSINARA